MIHKIIVFILALTCALPIQAEVSKEQKDRIDALFEQWNNPDTPGVAIGVIQSGELVYSNGYGIADLEHGVPITPSSVFYMASVSKHFVTMGILLLAEEGKIDLDVEIQEYLPDFPRYDAPLTIRHFIHHTSGVRDYLTLWSLAGNSYLDHISDEAAYQIIKNQKSLNFTPGSEYLYSNSCYFMLAMIIEKVSNMDINEFGEKYLFGPLGMKNSHFHNDVNHLIKNRVFSYRPNENGFDNLIMRFDLVGSGGLYSSIEDMFLWDQNFNNNKLGKGTQELIAQMHQEGLLNNGESTNYAFGLSNGTYKGLKTVGHGGALAGYRTHFLRFPEQQTSIVILANTASFNSSLSARNIADIVLAEYIEDSADSTSSGANKVSEEAEFISLTPQELETYSGTYVIRPGIELEISIENDSLNVLQKWNDNKYEIKATSEYTFLIKNNTAISFAFSNVTNGKANTLTIDQAGTQTVTSRKAEVGDINLEEFVGTFYSEELSVSYQIYLEDKTLKTRITFNPPTTLEQSGVDQFATSNGVALDFIRTDNKITSFVIDAGRVRGIEFIKTDSE